MPGKQNSIPVEHRKGPMVLTKGKIFSLRKPPNNGREAENKKKFLSTLHYQGGEGGKGNPNVENSTIFFDFSLIKL